MYCLENVIIIQIAVLNWVVFNVHLVLNMKPLVTHLIQFRHFIVFIHILFLYRSSCGSCSIWQTLRLFQWPISHGSEVRGDTAGGLLWIPVSWRHEVPASACYRHPTTDHGLSRHEAKSCTEHCSWGVVSPGLAPRRLQQARCELFLFVWKAKGSKERQNYGSTSD